MNLTGIYDEVIQFFAQLFSLISRNQFDIIRPIRFVDLEGSELVLRSEVGVLRRVANELFKSRQAGLNKVLGDAGLRFRLRFAETGRYAGVSIFFITTEPQSS